MSTSLVYRSARGYELLMRVLYGRCYAARPAVAGEAPAGGLRGAGPRRAA